jgi:hypothetical protein
MRTYPQSSAEAMAHVVAMMIITDTQVDPREIAVLDAIKAYQPLGLERKAFMEVVRDHCGDLVHLADEKHAVSLADPKLVDSVIGSVDDPAKRVPVRRLLNSVISADDHPREGELVWFDHILDRWKLTRDALANPIKAERKLTAAG